MNLSALRDLSREIGQALDRLPTANPLTLAPVDPQGSEDSRVRATIRRICLEKAPASLERIENEFFHSGPLEALLADDEVTEIILNGPESIWFEKSGCLHRHSDTFLGELTFRNFVARLSREAGMNANLNHPFADGRWRECRVHLIIPPATQSQALLTLRRHPRSPWSFESLLAHRWSEEKPLNELKELVRSRKNFLIVGSTGSGKTSVLNACLQEINTSERAVIIEDTDELVAPNLASVKLITRRDPQGQLREVEQSDLLKQALRMRPDRLVMGEVRGGEAKDLLMAFATGHSGCIGTLHADSARQALLRLEMLIQLGAPQWSLHAVRTLIWLSLQAIVVVNRDPSGKRRLDGIYRITSLEETGFLIERVS